MSVLSLALIGGIISAVTTSIGSCLAPLFSKIDKLRKYHLSMDFALGVMLSAVAFSLVGPEILKGENLSLAFSGTLLGVGFILLTHKIISALNQHHHQGKDPYKILLIATLIFHNFPEGMGAGASLAGMELHQAIPVQIAISIQNIAEGLLLTLLLKGLGLRLFWAVMGGVGSGLLEMTGAIGAGFMLQQTQAVLPFLLTLAGGAMMMSVFMEIKEGITMGRSFERAHFLWGLLTIPATNLLLS
jgi:zinc transporter, ZIP family